MSIATELTALQGDITAARTAITNMGGTVTANGGSSQLATDIATIPSGGAGIPREISDQGTFRIPNTNFSLTFPNNATSIGNFALYSAFYGYYQDTTDLGNQRGNNHIISVDFSNITSIWGNNALGYMCYKCKNLASVDMHNVNNITGQACLYYAFAECTNLTSVDFTNLQTISASGGMKYAFAETAVTSVSFPNLSTISSDAMNYCFKSCTSLLSASFPSLTSIGSSSMDYMFSGCSNMTSIHFRADMEQTIKTLSAWPNAFGTNNQSIIYFDL